MSFFRYKMTESKKTLDEKSFALGLEAKELPLEPDQLDRVAYNTGLQIYHTEKDFNDYYRITMGVIGFFRTVKDNTRNIIKSHVDIKEASDTLTEKYQGFLRIVNSVPQFINHTEKLEERVTSSYQTFREEEKYILS